MNEYSLRKIDRRVEAEPLLHLRRHAMVFDLLEMLEQNSNFLYQHRNSNHNSYYFLLIDKVLLLTEEPKKIYEIISLIIDRTRNGENKLAYMYPFLIQEGNRSIVKIALIRPPQEDKGVPRNATKFCEIAMKDSIPVLNRIIRARIKKLLEVPVDDPSSLVVKKRISKNNDSDATDIYPMSISFVAELSKFIESGFQYLDKNVAKKKNQNEQNVVYDSNPEKIFIKIKPIPMPYAVEDWLDYLVTSEQILKISNNYYIVYEKTAQGLEEVKRHIFVHKEALQRHILPKLAPFVRPPQRIKYNEKKQALIEYRKNKDHTHDKEEVKIIFQLMSMIPVENLPQEQVGFSIKNIQKSCDILSALVKILDRAEGDSIERIIKSIVDRVFNDSIKHKNITPVNLCKELISAGCGIDEDDYPYLKKCFDKLLSSGIAYYAHSDDIESIETFKDLYLVAPTHLSVIIANLGESALKDKNVLKSYQIAKAIEQKLIQDIYEHPELNSKLTKQQIETAKILIQEIDKKLENDGQEKNKSTYVSHSMKNPLSAIFFFIIVIILTAFAHPTFLLTLLLYPLFTKYILSDDHSSKKVKKPDKEESKDNQVNSKLKENILTFLKDSIHLDEGLSVISKVIDSNTIDQVLGFDGSKKHKTFLEKYSSLDSNILKNSNKLFKNVFEKEMISIVFRAQDIPEEKSYLQKSGVPFPHTLYIKRVDLASSTFRSSLSNFYRKIFAKLMPSEEDKQTYYRKIIELLENPREYNKYINLSK